MVIETVVEIAVAQGEPAHRWPIGTLPAWPQAVLDGAIPEADRPLFDDWSGAIVSANAAGGAAAAAHDAASATAELMDYFVRLVDRRRHDPGDDTVS